jgi:signal transduction histidine kinase/DNA-binding response OmpR family regulator
MFFNTHWSYNSLLITLFFSLFIHTNTAQTTQADIVVSGNSEIIQTSLVSAEKGDGIVNDKNSNPSLTKKYSRLQKPWIYLIIIFIFLGLIYSFRRYELSRIEMKNQMNIVKLESIKLKELDQRKSQFFANISHEFRTPLTLIMGRLEQLLENNTDSDVQSTCQQMHSNTSRLLNLINQLLDLSKFESGIFHLKAAQGDIIGFITGLVMSFDSLAEQRKIKLHIEIGPELKKAKAKIAFFYDADILEKIINNLVSNAFKFTPDNGQISVNLNLIRNIDCKEYLEITIEDTGIGISEEALPYIFDRFYQEDISGKLPYESSGIGLALVNQLVRIHSGEILATSKIGEGSKFILKFPTGQSHLAPDQIISDLQSSEKSSFTVKNLYAETKAWKNEKLKIGSFFQTDIKEQLWVLVVEDSAEVRQYITDCIQPEYKVMQASNALEGVSLAEEFIPDLIISDIMMPGMDGFTFCQKIKTSFKTSHIPLILLTARADPGDKISGLKMGADDYLTKPFQSKELQIRIKNLIENRIILRKKYSSNSIIKPSEISVSSYDATFIEKLMELVEKNMGNDNYSVEMLCKEVSISQSQLHRKLKAIINMSSSHFIRSVRMHRSMDLLKNGTGNISEIAFSVGYSDPGYFSKTFRKFFGKLPSEIQKMPQSGQ